MLERLVISNRKSTQNGRKLYFLFSSVVLCVTLVVGLVVSLFSKDLSLGAGDFEMLQLIAPIEQLEPDPEPEPPAPEEPPEQPIVKEQDPAKAQPPSVKKAIPTRRVNMARVNETPPAVPKGVSTRPNTLLARPDGYFKLGKVDLDHGAGHAPGRSRSAGKSSGSGSNVSRESVAGIKKPVPPPPPPIKKTPKVKKSITRSLGVINGNATSLPKPRYSSAAKAVGARGKVNVRVLINENGRVVSADAVSGHPLLRNAAEAAARQARFSQTLLSGRPVKVSGVIVYNFLS